jgi:hypothetical protein
MFCNRTGFFARVAVLFVTQRQAAQAEIKKQRVENTAALKPSLSNPNAKAELDDLDARCSTHPAACVALLLTRCDQGNAA